MAYRVTGYQPCAHASKAAIGHAEPLPLHLADHRGDRHKFAVRFSTNHQRDDVQDNALSRQH